LEGVYFGNQKWFTKTRRDSGKGRRVEVRGNKITHKTKTGEGRRGEERGGQLTRACFLGVNFITQHGVKDF
jgi:hypothetical protein